MGQSVDHIVEQRTQMGGRMMQLDNLDEYFSTIELRVSQDVSKAEDADPVQAFTDVTRTQQAFEAAILEQRQGFEAQMAQIMRARELVSEVPAQQATTTEQPAKRQKPQPRDLEAMARGQAAAPVQAQVLEAQEVAPPKGMHRPHQAKWAAASGQPMHARAETLIHAPSTASAMDANGSRTIRSLAARSYSYMRERVEPDIRSPRVALSGSAILRSAAARRAWTSSAASVGPRK